MWQIVWNKLLTKTFTVPTCTLTSASSTVSCCCWTPPPASCWCWWCHPMLGCSRPLVRAATVGAPGLSLRPDCSHNPAILCIWCSVSKDTHYIAQLYLLFNLRFCGRKGKPGVKIFELLRSNSVCGRVLVRFGGYWENRNNESEMSQHEEHWTAETTHWWLGNLFTEYKYYRTHKKDLLSFLLEFC